jgi:hypothetical protein
MGFFENLRSIKSDFFKNQQKLDFIVRMEKFGVWSSGSSISNAVLLEHQTTEGSHHGGFVSPKSRYRVHFHHWTPRG